jgi:GNAT superfamily N-acetyltransferase
MTEPKSSAPTVRLREIISRTDPALPAAYALLNATFARHERVTLNEWRAVLREREEEVWTDFAWHLLIAEQRGEVVGLATGTYVGSANVAMIGYLAMAPSTRGGGIGTHLRERLRHAFERDARRLGRPLAAILGEVSHDNPWLRALARRPKVLVLDLPYYQPSLRFLDSSSPYVLYYEACGAARAYLPMLELRRILFTIWRESYRLGRPLEHRAFRRMMRALDGRRHVGPHPDFPQSAAP